MAWDKGKPAGTQKIRLGDDAIRANNLALETALSEGHDFATGGSQTGKHTTPTFVDNGATPSQPTGTNEIKLFNLAGALQSIDTAGGTSVFGGVPSGTKMLFKQGSAPAGWTFEAEDNDRALINTSTEANGGTIGGDWTIGLSVDAHTLTVNEIPSHAHSYDRIQFNERRQWKDSTNTNSSTTTTLNTGSTGGDQGHSHGLSGDNGTWRPAYVKTITCQKQ